MNVDHTTIFECHNALGVGGRGVGEQELATRQALERRRALDVELAGDRAVDPVEDLAHDQPQQGAADLAVEGGLEGQESGQDAAGAKVSATIDNHGRADKVIVFKFKRKKQYKKIYGHRQPFTAVRITEIAFDGQKFTAPEEPVIAMIG